MTRFCLLMFLILLAHVMATPAPKLQPQTIHPSAFCVHVSASSPTNEPKRTKPKSPLALQNPRFPPRTQHPLFPNEPISP